MKVTPNSYYIIITLYILCKYNSVSLYSYISPTLNIHIYLFLYFYLSLFLYTYVDSLAAADLTDYIQIASFHPQFEFGDNSDNSAGNYTNRSPFPLIHLLRVDNVSNAIESYVASKKGKNRRTKGVDDSEIMDQIWKQNIVRMKRLGETKLKAQIVSIVKKAIARSNHARKKQDK